MNEIKKIPGSLKTAIIKEWLSLFPALTKYKPTILYCRKGALLIGIEFQWLMGNQKYRPYYNITCVNSNYNGDSLVTCMLYPFKAKKGMTLDIEIKENSLKELMDSSNLKDDILSQCLIRFDEHIDNKESLQRIVSKYDTKPFNTSKEGMYLTSVVLAGVIRDEEPEFSHRMFDITFERIRNYQKDIIKKSSWEKRYNKPFNEIVEDIKRDYNTRDFQKSVDAAVQKFALEKITL